MSLGECCREHELVKGPNHADAAGTVLYANIVARHVESGLASARGPSRLTRQAHPPHPPRQAMM